MSETAPTDAPLLTIDLGALGANWRLLRDRAGAAECAAVVKADAYGIGLEQAAPALARAGCRTFFVAQLSEAERLRAVLPDATVYVLNGLPPGAADRFIAIGARPILGSFPELREWASRRAAISQAPAAAIHIDTGMNRLGFRMADLASLSADPDLQRISPDLVMSHLVAAEEFDASINPRQIEAFAAVRAILPGVPASLLNSSGLFLSGAPTLDLVRPGYALYGGNPMPGRPNPMRPVVRLTAGVVQTRWTEAGETVGYNGRWTTSGRRRLATLSVGYADGLPRAASRTDASDAEGSARGAAIVAGRLCPFTGRVSMDLIVIDVTDVPEAEVGRGTPVTLIGDALDIDEVGRRAGTIGYEILTGLGPRYGRRYVGG